MSYLQAMCLSLMPRGKMTGAFVYLVLVPDLTGSQPDPWCVRWVGSRGVWVWAWSRGRREGARRCPAGMNITSLSLNAMAMIASKLLAIPYSRDHQSCSIELLRV